MKKVLAIAVVTLTILGVGAAFAGGHGFGHHRGMKAMGPGGPGGGMIGHMMRALHRLDLTHQQRTRIRSIVEAARPRFQEQMEAIRAIRDQLRDLDPAGFDEAAVRAIAKKLAAPTEELAVLHQQLRAKIYSVLTPEQRQELAEMRQEREQRRECLRNCMGAPDDADASPAPPAN